MRILIGAAVAACLIAAPAAAQDTSANAQPPLASRCGEFPAAPTFPDGARANTGAMERGQETYTAWRAQIDAVVACRNTEMTNWRSQYEAIGARNESDATAAAAVVAAWGAELQEYNDRQGRGGNRNRDPSQSRPQSQ